MSLWYFWWADKRKNGWPKFLQTTIFKFRLFLLLYRFLTKVTKFSLSYNFPIAIEYLLFYSLWVFHTSFSKWSFTRVWVTASLLSSPGLRGVFWPITTMLLSGWFRFLSGFKCLQAFFKAFELCSKCTNYN